MLGRAGGLGPRTSGLTTCRSFGVCGEAMGSVACGGMKTPCGLGRVLGPLLSWDWCLPGTDERWWLEETPGGTAEELRSLLLKDVERRTLDWASFNESL